MERLNSDGREGAMVGRLGLLDEPTADLILSEIDILSRILTGLFTSLRRTP